MQQRRLRLGDIVDDYCPRERRVTNHAIAAMVEDQITHTRCSTCEVDHEYKEARVPSQRRKRPDGSPVPEQPSARVVPHTEPEEEAAVLAALESVSVSVVIEETGDSEEESGDNVGNRDEDWPVHRRLIRATFPRPEGQPPEWKEPEFTNRQPTHNRGRFGRGGGGQGEPNGNRGGQPRRGGGRGPFQGAGNGQPRGDGQPRGEGRPGGHGGQGGGQGQPGQGQGAGGGGGRRRRRRGR